jgi:DNA-binding MarR family transcriptional regulator
LNDEMKSAGRLMETVPLIMRLFRREIRDWQRTDLSMPRFRTLMYLRHNKGATLSDLADHMGMMRPTASKMIDSLVMQRLVKRDISTRDRRFVRLCLTLKGTTLINRVRRKMRMNLAELIKTLPRKDRDEIARATQSIQRIFTPLLKPATVEETKCGNIGLRV